MQLSNRKNKHLAFALYYAVKLGWPVFPVHYPVNDSCSCDSSSCTSIGKHPMVKWKEMATTDSKVIKKWWQRYPKANIGIVTGARSGLFVLDIDPPKGGKASLQKLENDHGKIKTLSARTGGKGRHYYFQCKNTEMGNKTGILAGVDIRCNGGYIVASPSLHVSGRKYQWRGVKKPSLEQLACLPKWLLKLTQTSVKKTFDNQNLLAGIPEGKRNNTLASIAGSLRNKGFGEKTIYTVLEEINSTECNPPLDEEEVKKIATSYSKYPVNTFARNTVRTFTALELQDKYIAPLSWIVPDLIPAEGLVILAGAPKAGKSWFALSLCHALSIGGDALGQKLDPQRVLYLALEDSERRLQERLNIVSHGECSENLVLAVDFPKIDMGGTERLEELIENYSNCKLIVIDTWGRIGPTPEGRKTQYQNDYDAFAAIQALAMKSGLAILVITHLRKAPSSDPLQEVSGSIGVTGAADALLVIKRIRSSKEAELFVTGRDVEERILSLEVDFQTGKWTMLGEIDDSPVLSRARLDILEVLEPLPVEESLSPSEIASILKKPESTIRKMLRDMVHDRQVFTVSRGKYCGNKGNFSNDGAEKC